MPDAQPPLPSNADPGRRVFHAKYSVAQNDTWRDNPLIEALPKVLTDEEFCRVACHFPPREAEMRNEPKHRRLTYVTRALGFFVPMEKHVLLQQRLARSIRDGYVARNPLGDPGWSRLPRQLDDLAEAVKYGVAPHEPPSALGFAITGIGGVGKTTGVNAVMRTYPDVLIHRSYTDSSGEEHQLMRTQIVFLKLDCPEDGTLKSLCLGFFRAVDRLTGFTRYYEEYGFRGTRQRTATEMLPDMARVATLQSLGVLVIDEIQFLSKQKSGGREQMLHWFTRLVNDIKLPVVLVGTPRADEVLNTAFWQMRRNAGQGEFSWDRMEQDEEWERFLLAMWPYQYVRNPATLAEDGRVPRELSDALYRESQGIADFAVKMFMVAQERAINSGHERLTDELVEVVAENAFGKAREIIQGIGNNDARALAKVDDVKFDSERARNSAKGSAGRTVPTLAEPGPQAVGGVQNGPPPVQTALEPVLPTVVKEAVARGATAMQALRSAGYARTPTEFGV